MRPALSQPPSSDAEPGAGETSGVSGAGHDFSDISVLPGAAPGLPPGEATPVLRSQLRISRPDDPVRAVRSARGIRRSLRAFNARQRERGGLEIDIGIGISHGESISGNIGSEQRMEYTVIGDTVNLASRLEGLTKNHPYKILINDRIYEQVKDEFACVLIGKERVKGKAEMVDVYGIPDQT